MNILYTLNSGAPGGMERHVQDLVHAMVSEGHKVYVWCADGPVVAWYKSIGAEVYTNRIKLDIDLLYILKLARFIKEKHVEVIHSHELKAGVNSLLAGALSHVKVKITHVHTPLSEWKHSTQLKKMLGSLSIKLYSFLVNSLSNTEIALTDSRKKVKVTEGIKESKLTVIPNGLDFSKFAVSQTQRSNYRNETRQKFNIPEDAFVFSSNSRLTIEKGVTNLITAFSEFLKDIQSEPERNSFYLFISGGGELEESLRIQVTDTGLNGRVVITGIYSDEDLPKFYCVSDAFIFPSLAEGFGLVLIEAIYNELPVTCSNLEVLKEVSNNSLLYFDPQNPSDIADKMLLLYRQVKSGVDITSWSKKYIEENYTLETFTHNYINLYERLLKKTV